MAGPPAPTLWGPVVVLDRASGPQLSELRRDSSRSLEVQREPAGLAIAPHAAAREITALLAASLRDTQAERPAA